MDSPEFIDFLTLLTLLRYMKSIDIDIAYLAKRDVNVITLR